MVLKKKTKNRKKFQPQIKSFTSYTPIIPTTAHCKSKSTSQLFFLSTHVSNSRNNEPTVDTKSTLLIKDNFKSENTICLVSYLTVAITINYLKSIFPI